MRAAASTTAGSASSRDAIVHTGNSGSSAAIGPCARSVAVSGSAATRHVSVNLSAVSRAVANSMPRPITYIRATYANVVAIAGTARSIGSSIPARSSATRRIPSPTSRSRPETAAAMRASAASVLRYVFVAATARSGPAASGNVTSAATPRSDSGSFVTAIVGAPRSRARTTYSTTSGVSPDCDSATTTDDARSSCAS